MSLSITPEQTEWTAEQKKMLGSIVVGGRLDEGTALQVLAFCQATGLNPFTKQCYIIFRSGRLTLQAGVDGLAAVAQRAAASRGLVIGNRPTRYFTEDGKEMPFAPENLHALTYTMTVTDTKSGAVAEYNSTVLLREYMQSNPMWKKMTAVMLEKVALSKAYRMAFPTDLSGVYSLEEVDLREGGNDRAVKKPSAPVGKMSDGAEAQDPFAVDGPQGRSVGKAKSELLASIEGLGLPREEAIEVAKLAWEQSTPEHNTVSDDELAALKARAESIVYSDETASEEEEVSA